MQTNELLWNPLSGLTDWLADFFGGILTKFLSIFITPISFLLYSLQMGFFYVLDCVQGIFRSMAGLDAYYIDGERQTGDIVMSMLMNQTIVNIFIAVLVVSIMLLFVTTFVAIIRVEFTEKGAGNAKGPIIGRAIKSIAYFAVVPITCLFGIWIANVFLRSFDRATSGDSYSLSTTVFYSAAQNANRARSSEKIATKMMKNTDLLRALGLNESIVGQEGAQEKFARAVDSAFLSRLKVSTYLGRDSMTIDAGAQDYFFAAMLMNLSSDVSFSSFDTTNIYLTFYFYELLMGYNYLIGYVGGFMAASLLLSSAIGLIQRIYELAILFVISPAAVAFMPIDDGAKYKQWRGEFIKRVGMMYGPVIGLNLMFQVLAVLQHVTIFPDTASNAMFNGLIQLIFMIVGLLSIKEFSQIVSGLVGSSDAMQVGEGKRQDTIKMAQRVGQGTINAVKTGREVGKAATATVANSKIGEFTRNNAWASKLTGGGLKERDADKTLGSQFGAIMRGDKSSIGKAFGNFASAAGPVASYFTAGAIAKRKEEGRGGILGEVKMFGNNSKDKRTLKDRLTKTYDSDGKQTGIVEEAGEMDDIEINPYDGRLKSTAKRVGNAAIWGYNKVGRHAITAGKMVRNAYGTFDTATDMTKNNKKLKEEKDEKEKQKWRNEQDDKDGESRAKAIFGPDAKPDGVVDGSHSYHSGSGGDSSKAPSSDGGSSKAVASGGVSSTPTSASFSGAEVKINSATVTEEGDANKQQDGGDQKDKVEVAGGELEVKLADGTVLKIAPESFGVLTEKLNSLMEAINKTTQSIQASTTEIKGISTQLQGIYTSVSKQGTNGGGGNANNNNRT